jgi:hypothetical protein
MTDTDIRTALERATGELRTPPDLLDRVRAGGRRRVVRRRSVLAAGLATIAAGSTAGVWRSGGGDGTAPVASPLLDRATRGDLKGDAAFLGRVRATWRNHVGDIPVVGEPHVVWAGLAPHQARTAVVAQRVPELTASPAGQIRYGLTGFIEETPDGLRAISLEEMLTGAPNAPAALLGPQRNVLMVLDDGRDIRYSPDLSYTAAGKVERTFTPLDFQAHDGVAFEATGTSLTAIRLALRAGGPDAYGERSVGLANISQLIDDAGRGGPPRDPAQQIWSLAGADGTTAAGGEWDAETRDGFHDRYGYHLVPPADTWYIRGATGDGRQFVVQTLTGPEVRIRVLLSLGTPDPVLQGFTTPTAPLPVQVRLPDGQGTVVAGAGKLRYRVSRGDWLPVAGSAALVPAAAEQVEVTPTKGRAVVVTL